MEYGSILDWWIIPHMAFFIFVASAVQAKWEPKWWVHVIVCTVLAFGWEIPEHFLQRAYPETWVLIEHPLNAWVVDPLSDGLGWLIGALIGAWSKNRGKSDGKTE